VISCYAAALRCCCCDQQGWAAAMPRNSYCWLSLLTADQKFQSAHYGKK
jgi:hypothetical protein